MFVFSLKASDIKRFLLLFLVAVLIITGAYFLFFKEDSAQSTLKNSAFVKAATEEERSAYLESLGFEITADPLKVEEVMIPEEFDENYEKYNEIQKEQNFDLEKFKGCRVKKWTYEVTNYEGFENADRIIEANLLIYNDVIIGADLQCLTEDGFLKPLTEKSDKS